MKKGAVICGLLMLFGTELSVAGKTYKYCVTCPKEGIFMCEFDSGPVDIGKMAGQAYCGTHIGKTFNTSCSAQEFTQQKCGDKRSFKAYAERYDKQDLLDIVSGDPQRMAMAVAKTPVSVVETTVKVVKKPSIIFEPVIKLFKKIF